VCTHGTQVNTPIPICERCTYLYKIKSEHKEEEKEEVITQESEIPELNIDLDDDTFFFPGD